MGGSRYAFIETTSRGFIGQVATPLTARGPVFLPPQQIEVGGWRSYGAGPEVEMILAELRLASTVAADPRRYQTHAQTPGKHQGRYAERMVESWVARGRVRYILANTHNRHAVYSVLRLTAGQ
jgi:hypothetical protein